MTDRTFDDITIDQLRAAGSAKWSLFPDAIGAFVAEMDFGLPPQVSELLATGATAPVLGYLPPADRTAAREATAAWLTRAFDWEVAARQVFLVPDVLSVLRVAIRRFTPPGSAVIVPTPAYMPFLTTIPAQDRRVIEVPSVRDDEGRYHLDLEGIDAAFRDGGHLVVLCNPWNPVGRVLAREELSALADVVDRHGGRVFSDEIHAPLVLGDTAHVPYAFVDDRTAGHTITGVAASKGWNIPGLKCGQLILSNEDDIAAFTPYAADAGDTVGPLGARAATAVYTHGGPWLDSVVPYLRQGRDLLTELVSEHLPGVRLTPVEGTYIAWLDCRDLGLAEPAARFFRRRAGVALTDGRDCGAGAEGFVRFVFATPHPILRQAVEQMGAALRER